jgi:hypothetical protein
MNGSSVATLVLMVLAACGARESEAGDPNWNAHMSGVHVSSDGRWVSMVNLVQGAPLLSASPHPATVLGPLSVTMGAVRLASLYERPRAGWLATWHDCEQRIATEAAEHGANVIVVQTLARDRMPAALKPDVSEVGEYGPACQGVAYEQR